jgi:hypothetical protein
MILNNNTRNNCPDSFYYNCANKDRLCYKCKGGEEVKAALLYKPVKGLSGLKYYQHPCNEKRKQDKDETIKLKKKSSKYIESKINSAIGRREEKTIISKLECSHQNISSRGNDGYIQPMENFTLEYELKTRLNGFRWPSKKEWDKFKYSSQEIFIINSKEDDDIRVVMDLDTFNKLIQTINLLSNGSN